MNGCHRVRATLISELLFFYLAAAAKKSASHHLSNPIFKPQKCADLDHLDALKKVFGKANGLSCHFCRPFFKTFLVLITHSVSKLLSCIILSFTIASFQLSRITRRPKTNNEGLSNKQQMSSICCF